MLNCFLSTWGQIVKDALSVTDFPFINTRERLIIYAKGGLEFEYSANVLVIMQCLFSAH